MYLQGLGSTYEQLGQHGMSPWLLILYGSYLGQRLWGFFSLYFSDLPTLILLTLIMHNETIILTKEI